MARRKQAEPQRIPSASSETTISNGNETSTLLEKKATPVGPLDTDAPNSGSVLGLLICVAGIYFSL